MPTYNCCQHPVAVQFGWEEDQEKHVADSGDLQNTGAEKREESTTGGMHMHPIPPYHGAFKMAQASHIHLIVG